VETYIYFAMAAMTSRLVPVGLGVFRWASLRPAGRLLVAFIAISFVGDATMFLLGRVLQKNNLWVSHVLIAVQTPILLLALSKWMPGRLSRTFRIAALGAVLAWVVLTFSLESPTRFARVTGPLQAALFCLAAAGVLISRGLSAEGSLIRSDWFWVALGVLVLYGLTAVHRPLLDLFITRGVSAIPAWTILKALMVLQVITNLIFANALLLQSAPYPRRIPAPA
jgi:hypothetical protein